ncbi:MAG: site-2 protease family protein, partial [Thermoplasmata archaeon]|nr:site-2 protease family protein [Thermoplasmata archaeon]
MRATPGPIPSGGGSELDRIRRIVGTEFPIYDTRVGPQSLILAVQVDPTTLEPKFDRLRRELWAAGYVPILRRQMGEDFLEVVPRPRQRNRRDWVNIALLAATVATTTLAGALIWLVYVGQETLAPLDFLYGGLFFSVPVLTILGLHELAHFFMARRRKIDASLPYFIPLPPPFLFGTFGAFISIREPFPDKKALFDIGAAGPLAGFVTSIPIAIVGLYLSAHSAAPSVTYCGPTIFGVSYGSLVIGPSLFWEFLALFFPHSLLSLHPLALAGWVGIFVTSINLLPAGQLDGGHIFRALFGDRIRFVSYGTVILLFGFGIFYTGWLFFGILILLLGVRHPPPLNDVSPLDTKRYVVGAVVVAVLITGFVVQPLYTPTGMVSIETGAVGYSPSTPALPVNASLNFTIVNGDPVPHGFVLSATVENVSRDVNNTTVYLSMADIAKWASTSEWMFHLPGGRSITLNGSSVALSGTEYVTVQGAGSANSATVRIDFANSVTALAVV